MKYYDIHGRLLPELFNASGSFNAVGTTELQAAPGAGLHLYVTDLVVSAVTAGSSLSIREDVTGATLSGTYLTRELPHAASVSYLHFTTPIKLGENVNIGTELRVATDVSAVISGYITE